MDLYPSDYKVLDALQANPTHGLTTPQLAALTGLTERTVRQATYRLRKAGYRVRADRVFRYHGPSGA